MTQLQTARRVTSLAHKRCQEAEKTEDDIASVTCHTQDHVGHILLDNAAHNVPLALQKTAVDNMSANVEL